MLAGLLISGATGCGRTQEKIVTYDVPKSRSGLDALPKPPPVLESLLSGGSLATSETVPARMIVATLQLDENVWFFKIVGPTEQVDDTEPAWRSFLESVKFEDDSPVWELPEGWNNKGNAGGRFATLEMNSMSPPLEMAVTVFPMSFDELMNVNRWRGQIGLEPVAELESPLTDLQADGFSFKFYDDQGETAVAGVGMSAGATGGPFSGNPQDAPAVGSEETTDEPVEQTDIEFTAPEGWEAEANGMDFIRARFLKKSDEKEVRLTVSEMSLQNGWDDVVGQWSRQVGIESLSGPEAAVRSSKVALGSGEDAVELTQLRLIEPGEDVTTGIIGAMFTRGETNWFFKLSGDRELVSESEADFVAFLKSFRFKE